MSNKTKVIQINNVDYEVIKQIYNKNYDGFVQIFVALKKGEFDKFVSEFISTQDTVREIVSQARKADTKFDDVKTRFAELRKSMLKIIENYTAKKVQSQDELKVARHINKHFLVAIKLVSDEASSKSYERFKREVEFCLNKTQKNIIRYLDSEEKGDGLYAVMPYFKATLRDYIKNDHAARKKINLILQISDGLKYLHKKKIIHRDIKPENIFIDHAGNAVIADMGIAHFDDSILTKKGEWLANKKYAAPEQFACNNEIIGNHTDIFALGLIANEMFTKEMPHGALYKKIAEVEPLFYWLDDLVDLMIKQSYSERISDIEFVISEIKLRMAGLNKKLIDNNLIFIINMFDKAEKLIALTKEQQRKIKEQIKIDIFLGEHLFYNRTLDELNNYEINYHANIGYTADELLINMAILSRLYNICKAKFKYEASNIESCIYIPLDNNSNDGKELFNKLEEFLSAHTLSSGEYIKVNEIKKYFLACSHIHCTEILESINDETAKINEGLIDSPIIYLVHRIRDFFGENLCQELKEKKFPLHQHIAFASTHDFYKDNLVRELSEKEKTQLRKCERLFVDTFNAKVYREQVSRGSAVAVFNSFKKFDKFRKTCLERFKNLELSENDRYILEGDINDILKPVEFGLGVFKLKLNSFDINQVLAKLFPEEFR